MDDRKEKEMTEQTQAQLRDVYHVLQFLMRQVQPTDGVRAAMARLRESVKTEAECEARRLEALKDRRSYLIPQRGRLVEFKRSHDFTAANPGPMANARQRAEAKARAHQTAAQYEAVCEELADVEAAIAAAEKPEAA
jgi:hypothetical protein